MPEYPVSYRAQSPLGAGFQSAGEVAVRSLDAVGVIASGAQASGVLAELAGVAVPPPGPWAVPAVAFMAGFVAVWNALDAWEKFQAQADSDKADREYDEYERLLDQLEGLEELTADEAQRSEIGTALVRHVGFTKTQCGPSVQPPSPTCLPTAAFIGFQPNFQTCCTFPNWLAQLNNFPLATTNAYQEVWNQTTFYRVGSYWRRNAGYPGAAMPWPVPVVTGLPVGGTGVIDETDYGDAVYPTPWDLPIKLPGQVVAPAFPFPVAGVPRPALPPWATLGPFAPGVPGSIAIPKAGEIAGVKAPPLAPPAPVAIRDTIAGRFKSFPADPRRVGPPRGREKEIKMKGKGARAFKWMVNQVTEFRDFVKALHDALPKELRCKKNCNLVGMLKAMSDQRALAYMWNNQGFAKEALVQLITNEIIDAFYGWSGSKFTAAANALRKEGLMGDVAGFQTGSAYRPRVGKVGEDRVEGPSKFVEGYVRKVVDAVW